MWMKLSLRARLTLLSALVTASVAAALTAVSIFSADHIFVQQLPQELSMSTMTFDPGESAGTAGDQLSGYQVTPSVPLPGGGPGFSLTPKASPTDDTGYDVQITLAKAGRKFNLWGLAGLVFAMLVGAGITWLMAGRALKPIRELSQTIGEIGGNDLSRRVDPHGRQDEIGRLSESFNAMMDKVSASFERQKRFSASAAHELKTPLSTIQVGLEVLELDDSPSPDRMEKALAVAKTNTARMIRLVDDLFRLSSDEGCPMCDEIDFKELFTEILAELSPVTGGKRLSVSSRVPEEIKITGSRAMLYRALFNLVENAAKYNREGGSITLTATKEAEDVVVSVSDTGIGIPALELKHIFEPFYRVDRSRSRAVGGSGLGLPLVRDIVKKHHGSIMVESGQDQGTVFTLRFPLPAGDGESGCIETTL